MIAEQGVVKFVITYAQRAQQDQMEVAVRVSQMPPREEEHVLASMITMMMGASAPSVIIYAVCAQLEVLQGVRHVT